jgi:hypothetical protein
MASGHAAKQMAAFSLLISSSVDNNLARCDAMSDYRVS